MRVLVTAASRHGGTAEIGSRVAAELIARGHEVEVVDPAQVKTLDGFNAVVLGSAVYTGHWLPAAREFASTFAADLAKRPVWLFSSGLATAPAAAANSPAETRAVMTAVGARGHRAFGGRLDHEVLNLAERAIIAAARGRDGDHRDMAAVEEWAGQISGELARTAIPA
ncbi:flavodoxin domain-containing protein [Pengzhenrongella sp.]|jgi:menaquinone-dependent protoporphyrinogen oxidase|uniref:flavodoxin domain-containing protein n=1 Tax=Pengzhenrongella sp. TaxID=2888820 RepID=UPI002F923461